MYTEANVCSPFHKEKGCGGAPGIQDLRQHRNEHLHGEVDACSCGEKEFIGNQNCSAAQVAIEFGQHCPLPAPKNSLFHFEIGQKNERVPLPSFEIIFVVVVFFVHLFPCI